MRERLETTDSHTWNVAKQVLTDQQLIAVWLRYHEDFTVTQISTMLNVSRQAVYDRINGGKRRLMNALNEKKVA